MATVSDSSTAPAALPPSALADRLREGTRTLNPGYFALVMATGIMSVGMANSHVPVLSAALLALAITCYAALVTLTVIRLIHYRPTMLAQLRDPSISFGYFTFVAGTDVVGAALASRGYFRPAFALLIVGSLAWLVLGYVVPWTAVIGRGRKGPILEKANGTWFIWVVASQSVAVLAAALEPHYHDIRRELAILAVLSWSVGVFLYAAAGVFVAARMIMYPLGPKDLTPPYFVAMGATAITVVAGARIVEMADAPMVDATRGLAAGISVVFWAFGTWLVPALIAAGIWRHVVHRIPLTYTAPLWSVIFPLGMYGVGSNYLGHADNLPIVTMIGDWEIWIGIGAWLITFIAMLVHLWRTVIMSPRSRPA